MTSSDIKHEQTACTPTRHHDNNNSSSNSNIFTQEKLVAIGVSQSDLPDDDLTDTASLEASVLKTTREDAQDMQRMGKSQQLVRNFQLFSITSFAALATAAWEFGLFLITPALLNGGSPTLLWTTIYNFFLFGPIILSVAEMASMAPSAGCQYHWVSEFAPDRYQQVLSYIVGWVSTLAWQAGNAASALLVGTLIQVIIQIANPNYTDPPAWHATLLTIGAVTISYVGNVYGNKALPYWQNAVFGVHILAYFAVIVPIWVNAERATHKQVWIEFNNMAGWSNMALTVLVGQITAIGGYVGLDTTAHMSEEVKNASRSLPLAMLSVYMINFVIGFSLCVTLAYHLPDLSAALDDLSTYPAVYVLKQATSTPWLLALLAVTVTITTASNVVYLAAVTRDLFAFARDRGIPFSSWFASVSKSHVPANACLASSAIAVGLSLIYLGSSTAFYAIAGLYTVALLGCYITSISCCLWRRIVLPETMPPASFSLGRWGVPINAFAIVYAIWCFFWCFWPYGTPVDTSNMNWAAPIFVATTILALMYFIISGRHNYKGPVVQVRGRGEGPS